MSESPLAEPLSLRALLDQALRQARRHVAAVYWPVALPMAALGALVPLTQLEWTGAPRGMTPPGPGDMLLMMGITYLYIAAQSLGYSVLLAGTTDALAGREVSMRRAWAFIFRPRAFGTVLLSMLAFVVGLACCMLPGLYVALLLCLVVPVMVDEGRFGLAAFRRSSALATHNPRRDWGADPRIRAMLVVLVGWLLGYALNLAIYLPVGVLQQVMLFRDMAGGQPDPASLRWLVWLQVPTSIANALVQTAVHVYMSFGMGLLFFDVRRRKEGADLEAAVACLSQRPPPGAA